MKKLFHLLLALAIVIAANSVFAQCEWTQNANFGPGVRYSAVGFSIGTKGYVGTGYNAGISYNDFWEYDPATNIWTQKANFGGTGRFGAAGFAIGSKGYIGTGGYPTFTKDFWEYNPSTNTWVQKANFGGAARYTAVGFSIGAKGYIGTGYNPSLLKDFWEYNPSTDTWIQRTDFAGSARQSSASVGFNIGTKGYVGTGHDGSPKNDFWEYDQSTNIWTQRANFGGAARYAAVGFSVGTKGYIGTGYNDFTSTRFADFWEFNPSSNTWVQVANYGGTARYGATAFVIGNRAYVGTGADIGGYKSDFWSFDPTCTLSISISKTDVFCFGGSNGSATANVSGGTSPYSYKWNTLPIQTTQTATGLTAGSYSVTVTDFNNCTKCQTITIVQPLPIILSTSQINVSCNGGNNGSATVIVTGGNSPYTYLWSNGQTSSTATGLSASINTITVTDANNCTKTTNVTITEPSLLIANAGADVAVCSGESVNLAANVSGGVSPYTFLWSNGANTSGILVSPLSTTVFTVTVTDNNGCVKTDNVQVTVNTLPIANAGADKNILPGQGVQIGSASVTGNTYTWLPAAGLNNASISNPIAAPTQTTNYIITVTNAYSCSASDEALITVIQEVMSGQAIDYALLSSGNINSSDSIFVNGKTGAGGTIGAHVYASDSILSNNSGSVEAALEDLDHAISMINNLSSGTAISSSLNGQILDPGVYDLSAAASLSGTLNLSGNSASVYVFRINGGLTVNTGANMNLGNVKAQNIYWLSKSGTVSLDAQINFSGIVIANGNISNNGSNTGKLALLTNSNLNLTNPFPSNPSGVGSKNSIGTQIPLMQPPVRHWTFTGRSNEASMMESEDWIYGMIATSDGGYLGVGFVDDKENENHPPSVIKVNAHGQLMWDKIFDPGDAKGTLGDNFFDAVEVQDGYVIVGNKFDGTIDKVFVVKLEKRTGAEIYRKFIGGSAVFGNDRAAVAHSIKINPGSAGGGFIIAGTTDNDLVNSFNSVNAFLMKIDNNGNLQSSFGNNGVAFYGPGLFYPTSARNVIVSVNGNGVADSYVFTGKKNNGTDEDVYVVKASLSTGIPVWEKVFSESNLAGYSDVAEEVHFCDCPVTENNSEEGFDIVQIPYQGLGGSDGNYVISANFDRFDIHSGCICEHPFEDHGYLDMDGVLIEVEKSTGLAVKSKNYAHFVALDFFTPLSIIETDNGTNYQFIALGGSAVSGTDEAEVVNYLLKLDINFDVLWEKKFSDGTELNCPFALDIAKDGGYIVGGNNDLNHEDYYMVKLYSDCQPNVTSNVTTPYRPYDGETWTGINYNIAGEIILEPGVDFTISSSTLKFGDTKQLNDFMDIAANVQDDNGDFTEIKRPKITVKPGATLVVNNSTLKGFNECGMEFMWEGIEVWGQPTQPSGAASQGKIIINNSTIENAIMGVLMNKSDYNNDGHPTTDGFFTVDGYPVGGGGIIQATAANFKNCRRSVHFVRYDFAVNNNFSNGSFFRLCNFINDAPMADPDYITNDGIRLGNSGFVTFWDHHGLILEGNEFEVTDFKAKGDDPLPQGLRGHGISSFGTQFYVRPACNFDNSICTNTTFKGLTRGIEANGATGKVRIDNSLFENNLYGVLLNGTSLSSVTQCTFNISRKPEIVDGLTQFTQHFGIYATSATGYHFEQNTFNHFATTDQTGFNYGILSKNSSSPGGRILRNNFNSLYVANQMQADNSALENDCNVYTGSQYDWAVTSGALADQGKCATNIPTDPATNQFSTVNCGLLSKQIASNVSFEYNSYDALAPTCASTTVTVSPNCNGGSVTADACPSMLFDCCKKTTFNNISSSISILKNKIDGGNTQYLLNVIATQPDGKMKNELMNASPYLSDAVLKSYSETPTQGKNGVSPGNFKQVIITNSPVTEDVKYNIDARSLPSGIRQQIDAAQVGVSERKKLEQQILSLENEKQLLANGIVTDYLDSGFVDSAILFLEEQNSLNSKIALVQITASSDTATALQNIVAIKDSALAVEATNPQLAAELNAFADYYTVAIPLSKMQGGYFAMSNNEEQVLRSIANSNTSSAVNAQAVLSLVFNEEFERLAEPISELSARKTNTPLEEIQIDENLSLEKGNSFVTAFPNPANETFNLVYKLQDGTEDATFIMYDIMGKLIIKHKLISRKGQDIFNLSVFNNGLYYYTIIVNNTSIARDKLIVIKK